MLGCLLEIAETLALTLIIFFVIQTFVAQPYKVQQRSMQHTLEPEEYVLVDKLTPRFDTYKRGDIVVFTPPPDWVQEDGTPFIKRVIGLGGDTVDIQMDMTVRLLPGGDNYPGSAAVARGPQVLAAETSLNAEAISVLPTLAYPLQPQPEPLPAAPVRRD